MPSSLTLFVSLIWGSVGLGYFIYGKKQTVWPAMAGGLLMMAISYFTSPLVMTLASLAIIALVWWLCRRGLS